MAPHPLFLPLKKVRKRDKFKMGKNWRCYFNEERDKGRSAFFGLVSVSRIS